MVLELKEYTMASLGYKSSENPLISANQTRPPPFTIKTGLPPPSHPACLPPPSAFFFVFSLWIRRRQRRGSAAAASPLVFLRVLLSPNQTPRPFLSLSIWPLPPFVQQVRRPPATMEQLHSSFGYLSFLCFPHFHRVVCFLSFSGEHMAADGKVRKLVPCSFVSQALGSFQGWFSHCSFLLWISAFTHL